MNDFQTKKVFFRHKLEDDEERNFSHDLTLYLYVLRYLDILINDYTARSNSQINHQGCKDIWIRKF